MVAGNAGEGWDSQTLNPFDKYTKANPMSDQHKKISEIPKRRRT